MNKRFVKHLSIVGALIFGLITSKVICFLGLVVFKGRRKKDFIS